MKFELGGMWFNVILPQEEGSAIKLELLDRKDSSGESVLEGFFCGLCSKKTFANPSQIEVRKNPCHSTDKLLKLNLRCKCDCGVESLVNVSLRTSS